MKILKYPSLANDQRDPDVDHRIDQLLTLAKALAVEIETLRAELYKDQDGNKQIDFAHDGIDFYTEVERYEIELIKNALSQCDGNQTQAAKLLHLKSTTLNAKMKHYGLNPVRSIALQRQNAPETP